ncbi:MAG: class I SAM-dependent methyltransferase [Ectothiorhodospiraceae bacterium]|nr:class I SAM-dependent methyltransferase [Ectothiorhodospiraceae bacterium]
MSKITTNAIASSSPQTAADHFQALSGVLRLDESEYPVRLRSASRYSLWLEYQAARPVQCAGLFDAMVLETGAHTVELGQCRVIEDSEAPHGAYRLVPMAAIHDFEKLLGEQRVDVLDYSARNLPLILGYKQNVEPAFRDHVADVSYDLSVYRNLFDRLDGEYASEPEHVAGVVRQGIIGQLGEELTACLDGHVERMGEITAGFSKAQHSHHGFYLRKQLWNELLSAPFVARTNLKPRGYAGDSEMMRMCYRNAYEGDSTFGAILHKYSISSPAAQAVRNRRGLIARLVKEHADRIGATADNRLHLLSVACGPASELGDIFAASEDCDRLHYAFLDQDKQALFEAATKVGTIEKRMQKSLSVKFMRDSVRTLLAARELRERWGSFHFIYSMGLFDYLTRPVAEAVLRKLYALLPVGGELAIGNFHVNNPTRRFMDYWLDWPLYYRTEEEFMSFASGLEGADIWVDYDATGVQMLLRVRKTAA